MFYYDQLVVVCGVPLDFAYDWFVPDDRVIGTPDVRVGIVNVDIFALYIFSHNSCLSNFHENMYIVKITFVMLHRGNNIKNAKINPREIVNFQKSIHENIGPGIISFF